MINALNPPRSDTPFALLDVAGGTGDVAFRADKGRAPVFGATVCDINPEMLAVGRRAPRRGISRSGCRLSRAMRKRWHSRTAISTATPSRSASATRWCSRRNGGPGGERFGIALDKRHPGLSRCRAAARARVLSDDLAHRGPENQRRPFWRRERDAPGSARDVEQREDSIAAPRS